MTGGHMSGEPTREAVEALIPNQVNAADVLIVGARVTEESRELVRRVCVEYARAAMLAEVERLRAENERLRAERDAAGLRWGEHYNAALAERDAEIVRLNRRVDEAYRLGHLHGWDRHPILTADPDIVCGHGVLRSKCRYQCSEAEAAWDAADPEEDT
jgi:predicted fused transcriptional regulator/phosphomethylpyrimidine kinase